jgi:hypothetical protein
VFFAHHTRRLDTGVGGRGGPSSNGGRTFHEHIPQISLVIRAYGRDWTLDLELNDGLLPGGAFSVSLLVLCNCRVGYCTVTVRCGSTLPLLPSTPCPSPLSDLTSLPRLPVPFAFPFPSARREESCDAVASSGRKRGKEGRPLLRAAMDCG